MRSMDPCALGGIFGLLVGVTVVAIIGRACSKRDPHVVPVILFGGGPVILLSAGAAIKVVHVLGLASHHF